MNATYSELRARARESLRGNWGKAIGSIFLAAIPSFVLGMLGIISQSAQIAENIVSFLIAGMLALGTITFYLGIARKQNPPVTTVYHGFNNPVKAFLLYLLTFIFTMLWALLLIIPGIIAGLRYSMAYYILADNPEIGPLEAIRRSKQMMAGHKWRFFVLQLTFIGWALLCIPTIGIGFLWLTPYIAVTTAHFYDDLKNKGAEPPAPSDV
ncbi:DUF975 family protein [Cohnella endophytica]|uniref:DUF975 family protein n=1 Tax=Cohnella endophytica TaxID=2419778 RepID=A0A494XK04_9BACL|nr:DUF975 family protein [Cohnella endophytica]RKP47883.1 DUF975 family protein [Cohnella endophytica]